MKRLTDIDEYQQSIPKSKKLSDLETHRFHVIGQDFVSREEFEEMQELLRKQLEEQLAILEQVLIELQQSNLHLAVLSDEDISSEDVEGAD